MVRIADGDTFDLERLDTGAIYRIRVYGIDCPELNQPGGREALDASRNLLNGAVYGVVGLYLDNYDRLVAILINQENGRVLQEELISGGMCWVYDYFCRDCQLWQDMQTEAKTSQRGLWSTSDPIPPWDWRRSNPSR